MSLTYQLKRKVGNIIALIKYPLIIKLLEKHNMFFFFPFWQTGGGERVHADILSVFSDLNPLCFLTDNSLDIGFKNDFKKASKVVELDRWSLKRSYLPIMLEKMASIINQKSHPIIFGCHSPFFYSLIPYMKDHVKIIDLTHAFTFNPYGPENYSLPHVKRINFRVILGENTKKDYQALYQKNDIPLSYLDRLRIIPNKVNLPSHFPKKDYTFPIKVLFVSRNAPEKRPEIFLRITELSYEKQLPVEFLMIGKFYEYKDKVQKNTQIIGEVFNKTELNQYYSSSHFILVTSWREGFPMVLLEGMSHGVIPISTDVGEIPYYISKKNKNGYLVQNSTDNEAIANEFINTISHVIENIPQLEEYSTNCYHFIKEHFRPEKFNANYRNVFTS